jgi:hypothetical protein
MKIKLAVSAALILASNVAAAGPTLLATTAPTKDGRTLVSLDFVPDASQPVSVIVARIGVKDEFLGDKRINLSKCSSESGKSWTGCSLGHGDFTLLVDGGGSAIAAGNLGTFVVPTEALERRADGSLTVPLIEFTGPDGKQIDAVVEGDADAAGAKALISADELNK